MHIANGKGYLKPGSKGTGKLEIRELRTYHLLVDSTKRTVVTMQLDPKCPTCSLDTMNF